MRALVLAVIVLLAPAVALPAHAQELKGSDYAVAAFNQPTSNYELIAGYIPKDARQAEPKVLRQLDEELAQALRKVGFLGQAEPGETIRCEELVLSGLSGSRTSPLEYWRQVGECVGKRYILVPVLIDWRERLGSDLGVREAATVVLDLNVIDVQEGALVDRFHFEETQKSLSENLLDLPKFLDRGAKWVTAMELAREALAQGVKELGL
jgi:hypothetical protein